MADAVIVAEGLGKRFGPVLALDGVDLELPAGSVLGLLGPNGAGKTTTVRILATLLKPDRGRARVAGFDVAEQPQAVRRLIGLSGQYAAVDPFLTGQENLVMIGRLYGLTRRRARQRAGELTVRLGLAGAAGRLVRTYSGGMRRRLDVAASLLAAPPVLFLDEPTTGLDPRGRLALWQVLGELTAQGTSLLLTTQYIEEAERLAGMIVIIDHGRVIASGTPGQLRARAGGDRLDLNPRPARTRGGWQVRWPRSARAEPAVDEAAGRVVLPVADGAWRPPRAWPPGWPPPACTSAALALRRPTLEEAFLAVTGQPASGTQPPQQHAGSQPSCRSPASTGHRARHDRHHRLPPPRPEQAAPALAQRCHHHRAQPAAHDPGAHPAGVRHRAAGAVRAAVHLCLRRGNSHSRGGPLHRLPAARDLRAGDRVRRLPDRGGHRRRPVHRHDRPVPVPAHH